MARYTRQMWLEEGLNTLTEIGVDKLTIDLMTTRLKVTKGSFYHHFKGLQDYKTQLLEFLEEQGTLRIIDMMEQATTPQDKLKTLINAATGYPPDTEVAVRAWALQDALAREYQERIDQRRIAYVQDVFQQLVGDETQALLMSRMLYTILVGGYQIMPPLDGKTHHNLFFEMMRLYEIDLE